MKKYIIFCTASLLLLLGCQKLEEYNENPNELVFVSTGALLNYTMNQLAQGGENLRLTNLYCQYFSENQSTNASRYQISSFGVNFKLYYHSILNLQEIIRLCMEEPEKHQANGDAANQIAQARILKAWLFQNLTDTWGDIPYSEVIGDQLAPAYDTQEFIYHDLLRELEEAVAQIRPDVPGPVGLASNSDFLYLYNMENWQKFANSLTLRIAIRMADRDWPSAKAAIEKAFSGGVFSNNYENAVYYFNPSPDNSNPSSPFAGYFPWSGYSAYCISKPLMDAMKALDDPRIPRYAAPALNTGLYEGKRYGLPSSENYADDWKNYSTLSETAAAPAGQVLFLDYAEVCFTLAEAIERGAAIPGSAAEWYHKGIRASQEAWWVDAADIDAYLARPDVNYDTAPGTWKEKIGKQKWLALFLQGEQAWFEWRRLDFGILQPPPGLDFIATRYVYPDMEQILNKASYDEAVSRLPGGDKVTSKVWWDVY